MAKKISNEQFIDSDFLKPAIDRVKELITVIDDLQGTLKKVGAESEKALSGLNPAENVKDSIKLNETLERLAKTEERLAKLEEEKAKSLKTLKTLQDNKNKQEKEALDIAIKTSKVKQEAQKQLIAENKVTQQNLRTAILQRKERERQFKNLEAERKAKKKQLTQYQIESRRLTELRNKYKDLAVSEKANTKEAKELLKEVTKLDKKLKEIDDSVGQNTRTVGKYENALNGLNNTVAKLGIVAVITKGIELLGNAFGNTREGALGLEIAFSKITESVKVLVQSFINAGPAVVSLFSAIGDSFSIVGVKADIVLKKLDRSVSILPETIAALDAEIAVLEGTLSDLEKSSVSDSIDSITKAFEGNIETTSNAITEQEKFLQLQLKTTISISEQEKALAGLGEQRQILQDISDDDTLGFIERQKFVDLAQKAAVDFAKLENTLALTKEKLTIEAIKQDLRRSKALEESQIQAIKTGEQLQKVLQNEAVARKVSDANDEAFTAAFVERKDKQLESEAFFRDQEEKNRKTARDGFEQELDIIEEFGEKRIAINQKVIDSDTATLEQRNTALLENEKIEKQLFDQSIARIIKQGQASIDLRKDLTEAEKEQRKELLANADIQAILNSETETETLALIKKLDLGEIETNRLKETIKINQDLTEARKESTKALDEAGLKTAELQAEILLQEKALAGEVENIEESRLDLQKKNLQERIDLLEEDSIKRLELEKQLNDLLLEEQATAEDKAKEKREKDQEDELQKRQELYETAGKIFENFLSKQNEENLASLDKQISDIEERQNTLRGLAENGNEEAVKSLAESEKREAEIRREKEKELQRQQRIEAGLAAFQLLAAKAKDDPETALPETLKEILTLSTFVNGLPAFYEGTENIGDSMGGPHLNTAKDAYLSYVDGVGMARLDGGERIVPTAMNRAIGGLSNEELTQLAIDSKRGVQNTVTVAKTDTTQSYLLKELLRETKKKKGYDLETSFNQRTGVLTEVYTYANKISKNHKKVFVPTKRG